MDTKAQALLHRFEELRSERRPYESFWQEIRELVRPGASDFQATHAPGDSRVDRIYDGTAPQALMELAGGLHSFMTSPVERWFLLETNPPTDDPSSLAWLEFVSDRIYTEYARDSSTFNSAIQEAYQDIGAFGTCVVNQEYIDGLRFRAMALADCYLSESADGRIDGVHRKTTMSRRQLEQMFGERVPREIIDAKDGSKKYEVIHMVFPREDRMPFRIDASNMRFASFWVLKESKESTILKESGFNDLPYHVGRWDKLAMETYGRGPAMKCLPDIKMLNRMEYTNIKAVTKAADPPLMVPNDGFLGKIKTYPGAINMMESGLSENSRIEMLPTSDKILVALEFTEQKRTFIKGCFYADWVKLAPKRERQTAYEVAELVDQQLRMMAPMTGRMQSELLSPMIERSYNLLLEAGQLPPPPLQLSGQRLKVVYTSAAAQAQRGQKAVQLNRWMQALIPMSQVDLTIMDAVDTDAYAKLLGVVFGVPRSVVRLDKDIAAMREARAQNERVQAVAELAEPASKAVKNLADARRGTTLELGQ